MADTTRASKLQFFFFVPVLFFFTQVRQVKVVFLRTLRNAATRLQKKKKKNETKRSRRSRSFRFVFFFFFFCLHLLCHFRFAPFAPLDNSFRFQAYTQHPSLFEFFNCQTCVFWYIEQCEPSKGIGGKKNHVPTVALDHVCGVLSDVGPTVTVLQFFARFPQD